MQDPFMQEADNLRAQLATIDNPEAREALFLGTVNGLCLRLENILRVADGPGLYLDCSFHARMRLDECRMWVTEGVRRIAFSRQTQEISARQAEAMAKLAEKASQPPVPDEGPIGDGGSYKLREGEPWTEAEVSKAIAGVWAGDALLSRTIPHGYAWENRAEFDDWCLVKDSGND